MKLTRHQTNSGARWAMDGFFLPPSFALSALLELRRDAMMQLLATLPRDESANDALLAPIDALQEVWAAGVTYLRSRDARRAESQVADVYERVYDAARPELFFKAAGWRVVGTGMPIRIRADSRWNVPEPELVIVINRHREIVGYCAGNDVSSRDIEGENPLYLPQAKVYTGSCALGHGIVLCDANEIVNVPVRIQIERGGAKLFAGEATTAMMKRTLSELAEYLTRELAFPHGVFLMTGTCVVPGDNFSLQPEDVVRIQVGEVRMENRVASYTSNV
ncbi:MAG: fumarylacetoacetate hydrolase family protein [Chloroflexi bacterium]|nr:fumarylacetoacetate hydrolase family protein [Chloroflexota bacterium]